MATPYSRNPVSVPMPSVPVDDLVAGVPEQRRRSRRNRGTPSAPRTPPATARGASRSRRPSAGPRRSARAPIPRGRSSSRRGCPTAPPRRSSCCRAIVSWTWVLTRWSGRPKTIATAINAGASSRTTSSSVGLSVNRMIDRADEPDERRQQARDGLGQHRAHERHVARQARDRARRRDRLVWKSSDRVMSRPKSSPRSWATTRSPTTPSRYVWTNPPTAWTQNRAMRITISRSSPAASPPATTSVVMPAMIKREREARPPTR